MFFDQVQSAINFAEAEAKASYTSASEEADTVCQDIIDEAARELYGDIKETDFSDYDGLSNVAAILSDAASGRSYTDPDSFDNEITWGIESHVIYTADCWDYARANSHWIDEAESQLGLDSSNYDSIDSYIASAAAHGLYLEVHSVLDEFLEVFRDNLDGIAGIVEAEAERVGELEDELP